MAQVIQDPGMKDTFDDIGKILMLAGQAEKQRQQRQATDSILAAMASGDDMGLQKAIQAATSFEATYSKNPVLGTIQKVLARGMPGASPGISALAETGIPVAQAQEGLSASKARSAYYQRPTANTQGLFVRDAEGNVRPYAEGDVLEPGEEVVRPGSAREMDPTSKSEKMASAYATWQAALETATTPERKKFIEGQLKAIEGQLTVEPASQPLQQSNMQTGQPMPQTPMQQYKEGQASRTPAPQGQGQSQYSVGQTVYGKYKVVGFDTDGEPLVEEIK